MSPTWYRKGYYPTRTRCHFDPHVALCLGHYHGQGIRPVIHGKFLGINWEGRVGPSGANNYQVLVMLRLSVPTIQRMPSNWWDSHMVADTGTHTSPCRVTLMTAPSDQVTKKTCMLSRAWQQNALEALQMPTQATFFLSLNLQPFKLQVSVIFLMLIKSLWQKNMATHQRCPPGSQIPNLVFAGWKQTPFQRLHTSFGLWWTSNAEVSPWNSLFRRNSNQMLNGSSSEVVLYYSELD